jgi:hypothetical protein
MSAIENRNDGYCQVGENVKSNRRRDECYPSWIANGELREIVLMRLASLAGVCAAVGMLVAMGGCVIYSVFAQKVAGSIFALCGLVEMGIMLFYWKRLTLVVTGMIIQRQEEEEHKERDSGDTMSAGINRLGER